MSGHMHHEPDGVRISIRRVTLTLALISAGFTVLGLVTQMLSVGNGRYGHLLGEDYAHLFDLDAEATLPAWYQTAMLLASAALLWMIGASRPATGGFRRHWKFLAWVFVYISADENAGLHETIGFWISEHSGDSMGVYAWLIPGLAFVIFIGLVSWRFLKSLPPPVRTGMMIAAAVYVAGAAGVELLEAPMDPLVGTLPFSIMVVIEETLEMAGLVMFIHALLSHLSTLPRHTALVVEP